MALACPVEGLAFDRRTLALPDADGDGRIRAPDVIAAVRWVARRLKHPDDLLKHTDFVLLDALDDSTPEGGTLRAAALKVLASLGKPDATGICPADVEDLERILAGTTLNADGVIVPETAADEATRSLIEEILSCMGTVKDRSGRAGVDEALVERFFAECAAWEAWIREGESRMAELWPLGEETDAALAAWSAVCSKVDGYFQRCRLVAFDPQAHAQLNPGPAVYPALGGANLAELPDSVRVLPLGARGTGQAAALAGGFEPGVDGVHPGTGAKGGTTAAGRADRIDRGGLGECVCAAGPGGGLARGPGGDLRGEARDPTRARDPGGARAGRVAPAHRAGSSRGTRGAGDSGPGKALAVSPGSAPVLPEFRQFPGFLRSG